MHVVEMSSLIGGFFAEILTIRNPNEDKANIFQETPRQQVSETEMVSRRFQLLFIDNRSLFWRGLKRFLSFEYIDWLFFPSSPIPSHPQSLGSGFYGLGARRHRVLLMFVVLHEGKDEEE
ncbi:hypothetical protein TNCV_4149711 [Trichonephila clavipes]|uniref:Uncharacterized protein n=1 Tax=Trichonephila clavipes TaxID=2585209 RepID=A0A8X6W5N6_TRICX|nr:hypothetical protein TNCV_4149711 [Trichonephila clavipes]